MSGHVWDLSTIGRVLRLSQRAHVSAMERMEDDGRLLDLYRDKMVKALQHAAATHAVVLHPDDLELQVQDDPAGGVGALLLELRWHPPMSTVEVLLQGGPQDGATMVVHDIAMDLHFASRPPLQDSNGDDGLDMMVTAITDAYRWSGWHEDRRHWVMRHVQ